MNLKLLDNSFPQDVLRSWFQDCYDPNYLTNSPVHFPIPRYIHHTVDEYDKFPVLNLENGFKRVPLQTSNSCSLLAINSFLVVLKEEEKMDEVHKENSDVEEEGYNEDTIDEEAPTCTLSVFEAIRGEKLFSFKVEDFVERPL